MRGLLLLALSALSHAAAAPPSGSLVVGPGEKFSKVGQAVSAAQPGQTIYIKAGTYVEQVSVEAAKKGITLIGETAGDASSYSSNKVTIKQGKAQDNPKGTSNDMTATLRVHANNVKVYNINLENTRGQGSQALALSAYGDDLGFYGCQFKGFQDTVLSEKGRHFFGKCMIAGATDFIFGRSGQAWFESCDIKTVNAKVGYVTANGRDKADNPSYYVFNNCDIGGSAPPGSFFLGRPWREYSRVAFQKSKMGAVINKEGWAPWNKNDSRTSKVAWGEYQNSGPGAGSSRKFGKQLSSPVAMSQVLGSSNWIDSKFMGRGGAASAA